MTSRERFEAQFPIPEGVRWNSAQSYYEPIDTYVAMYPYRNTRMEADFYHCGWRGYQAATADCRKIAQDMNAPAVAGAIGGDE